MNKIVGLCLMLGLSAGAPAGAAGDAPLLAAARNRDTRAMRVLIDKGVDVNATAADGARALHWAAHWDDIDAVTLLIHAGADVNAVNDYGVTPLSLAATNGNPRMIETLLTSGANPNLGLPDGETPLMTAARTGRVDAVRLLLAKGADVTAKESGRGQTALMWAAAEGHADVVRLLVEHGADPNARSTTGFSPLLFAARAGDLDTVRALLATGARIKDTAASDGSTPLLVATIRGHVDLALFLLDHGADPNADASGYTALQWAAGTWETTLRFRDQTALSEWSPLTGLKGQAKLDFIRSLLTHGADVNARTAKTPPRFGMSSGGLDGYLWQLKGATPFLIAAMAGDAAVMRLLVVNGADPLQATDDHMTPLMQAAGIGRITAESLVTERDALDAVSVALELGGDVNAVNDYGETALHGAAASGFNSVVRFLAEKGARLSVKSKNGDTPLMIASGQGTRRAGENILHESTAALLRELGSAE